VIEALADTTNTIEVYDSQWRMMWISDELKELVDEHDEERLGYGKHMFEAACLNPLWVRVLDPDNFFELALTWTPLLIENTPGGKKTLTEIAWSHTELGSAHRVLEGRPRRVVRCPRARLPPGNLQDVHQIRSDQPIAGRGRDIHHSFARP
jgi:hypothetical protein